LRRRHARRRFSSPFRFAILTLSLYYAVFDFRYYAMLMFMTRRCAVRVERKLSAARRSSRRMRRHAAS